MHIYIYIMLTVNFIANCDLFKPVIVNKILIVTSQLIHYDIIDFIKDLEVKCHSLFYIVCNPNLIHTFLCNQASTQTHTIYTHIHTYIHTYICSYTGMHIQTYTLVHTPIFTHSYMYMHTFISASQMQYRILSGKNHQGALITEQPS